MEYDQLKLENQICFPLYAASRLITRSYQPLLDSLGITYPQYLVMLVLWEHKQMTVNDIAGTLILNTNTLTPLLKRLETMKLIKRTRSSADERKVIVSLTKKGENMQQIAADIPAKLVGGIGHSSLNEENILDLKSTLNKLITILKDK